MAALALEAIACAARQPAARAAASVLCRGSGSSGLQALQQQHHHHQQQRQYAAADAPEPMIVPAAARRPQQQQQQPGAGNALAPHQRQVAVALPDANRGPWQRAVDKASGQPYWWNQRSNVTTPVGAPKPDAWVAVVDERSGAEYFWNTDNGETTAVGEPLPGPEGRLPAVQQQQQLGGGRPSFGGVLANSLAMGFGVGLVFGVIRLIF